MTSQHDNGSNKSSKESLLTPIALQLSMTAPRCPPYFTAQRAAAVGHRPHPNHHPYLAAAHHHHATTHHHEHLMDRFIYKNKKSSSMTQQQQQSQFQKRRSASSAYHNIIPTAVPHPHLPHVGPDFSSQLTRLLGTVLPLKWQNQWRDTGTFGKIADNLVKASLPVAALSHPSAAKNFVKLSRNCKCLYYASDKGKENVQFLDVFFPENASSNGRRGMVFFVHGGAWGSGKPWFYRLAALPFLRMGLAVAIVGYRVYPLSQTVQDQVDDLEAAFETLVEEYPQWCDSCDSNHEKEDGDDNHHYGTIVMGHSSGAHIALLWLVDRVKRRMRLPKQESNPIITTFVGMSGPYNIEHHFDYEAARGVEEISPLKPCNGYTREQFLRNSPVCRLQDVLKDVSSESGMQDYFPRWSLLIHGIEDDTVPFTASCEAARVLRSCGVTSCDEIYVPETGHQDCVVALMLGGRAQTEIVEWLKTASGGRVESPLRSKL